MELNAYCREKGLYPGQIKAWREACIRGNRPQDKNLRREASYQQHKRKISTLERELKRKEKALAEQCCLVGVAKKVRCPLGGPRGRLTALAERQRVVNLIQEAIQSGARQQQACEVLELSSRTYQRWMKDRCGQ